MVLKPILFMASQLYMYFLIENVDSTKEKLARFSKII